MDISFDDIFDHTGGKSNLSDQPFNKEEWAEKKQAERQAVYEMADNTADQVCTDGKKFRAYLNIQTRFDRYSVTNALLILAQMPDAKQIKDFDGWKDTGASIKRQQKGISILEPGEEYERDDGTIGTSYNVKKVFDISQTTARVKIKPSTNVGNRILLKALIHKSPVPIMAVDNLPDGVGAYYDHEQQAIFVRRGMGASDIFRSVSMELAHAELAANGSDYTRESAAFSAYCASYMLCQKNSIDVQNYDFTKLPDDLLESDSQTRRETLSEIRDTAENISRRMYRFLEQNKAPKIKEQER